MPALPTTPLQHHFVPTGAVTLHVVTAGPPDGPPLLLLHGFPEYWAGWQPQIGALAAAGFRVIVPDQRGYNLSDRPQAVADYAIDGLADDVVGLLDHFGIRKTFLAGHDWGALVAWQVAMRHPSRLRRLATLNGPHPAAMAAALRQGPQQILRSWHLLAFQLPLLPELAMRTGLMAAGLQATSRRGTFDDAALARYHAAWMRPGARTGMLAWYRALLRHPAPSPRDPVVTVPAHIIWGRRDNVLGPDVAEQSLSYCRDGRLTFIDDATHWVQHEAAAQVNALLIAWFAAPNNVAGEQSA